MENKNQSYLGTEPIKKLMGKYAIPCIISLLVGALYNIVDQIFIANADYLGSYGNAANTVVFPLTVIALAGALINIILDPIFIFLFKWGMMGAAVATVLGQIVTAVLAVWYIFNTRVVKLSIANLKPNLFVIRNTLL